jgi:hypothetical protein
MENLLCSPWEDGGQQWQRLRARRLELDVVVGGLRGSSGYKKQSYGFLMSSSSSLIAQSLVGGGESSSRSDILLALRLRFVGKIR